MNVVYVKTTKKCWRASQRWTKNITVFVLVVLSVCKYG